MNQNRLEYLFNLYKLHKNRFDHLVEFLRKNKNFVEGFDYRSTISLIQAFKYAKDKIYFLLGLLLTEWVKIDERARGKHVYRPSKKGVILLSVK